MSNVAAEAPLANSLAPPSSAAAPVESPAEAEQLMVHLMEVMEALLGGSLAMTRSARFGDKRNRLFFKPFDEQLFQ
jgi:hypothetical protein